jgi:hypothetical protein
MPSAIEMPPAALPPILSIQRMCPSFARRAYNMPSMVVANTTPFATVTPPKLPSENGVSRRSAGPAQRSALAANSCGSARRIAQLLSEEAASGAA